jgi:hypothetical protein
VSRLPPFSSNPIFIAGDNRSGTTLLAIILDSHPALVIGPELDFREPEDLGPAMLRCLELLARDDPRVRSPGVDAEPPFTYTAQLAKQCHRFGIATHELAELVHVAMRTTGTELVEFADRCVLLDAIGEARRRATQVQRWGLKIQRELLCYADWAALWPRAKFVQIVRDGRDVAASHLRSDRLLYYTSITHAAEGWAQLVRDTRALVSDGRVHELRYEDLIVDPEATLRPLLEYLELDWDPAVLDHTAVQHDLFAHPYRHPSVEAVSQPLHPSAIGRYRTDLSPEELATFHRIAGEWLARMGYDRLPC